MMQVAIICQLHRVGVGDVCFNRITGSVMKLVVNVSLLHLVASLQLQGLMSIVKSWFM